jgi:hypothetical protein
MSHHGEVRHSYADLGRQEVMFYDTPKNRYIHIHIEQYIISIPFRPVGTQFHGSIQLILLESYHTTADQPHI